MMIVAAARALGSGVRDSRADHGMRRTVKAVRSERRLFDLRRSGNLRAAQNNYYAPPAVHRPQRGDGDGGASEYGVAWLVRSRRLAPVSSPAWASTLLTCHQALDDAEFGADLVRTS